MLNWHKRQLQKHINFDYENRINHLESDVADLKALVMAQKIEAIHSGEFESYEVQGVESVQPESAYSLAIELAKKGAHAESLVKECGLSRAEADLIVAIYHGVYKG
ncbi:DUF2802 domain-containing protein [Chitinibacter sp. FCG-7]|uniref:DUF2802 domain-containing protein n=1 Tax=Chitinibacter mangrovi TaxID=3153927 RepID=A0AAU7FAF9_9NEIS